MVKINSFIWLYHDLLQKGSKAAFGVPFLEEGELMYVDEFRGAADFQGCRINEVFLFEETTETSEAPVLA